MSRSQHRARSTGLLLAALVFASCGPASIKGAQLDATALSDGDFATLVERLSEPGGFFDTDNLISNEGGYLKVMDALDALGLRGGAYVGVGSGRVRITRTSRRFSRTSYSSRMSDGWPPFFMWSVRVR